MTSELRRNLPHIIAIFILILALLIVATKVGIMRCSDLGNGFCQLMDTIFGRKQIILVYGQDGIGDPIKTKNQIESMWRIPVYLAHIDSISGGTLDRYDMVIVEKCKEIPTSKLQYFNDYIMRKVDGRLVWVGDAGTFGGPNDMTCRILEFNMHYTEKIANNTRLSSKTHQRYICVEEKELNLDNVSLYQSSVLRARALEAKAFEELEYYCDSFAGKLNLVDEDLGYKCELPANSDYLQMYFEWQNKDTFDNLINPWNRGNYTMHGSDTLAPGIEFGTYVLGLSFIADDFAVKNYQDYETDLELIQEQLFIAHDGFISCRESRSATGCSLNTARAKMLMTLGSIKEVQSQVEMDFSGYLSSLESIKAQKALNNDSSGVGLIDSSMILLSTEQEAIRTIDIPTDTAPTLTQTVQMNEMKTSLQKAVTAIATIEGSESDDVYKSQYEKMRTSITTLNEKLEGELTQLEQDTKDYKTCEGQGGSTVQGGILEEIGNEHEDKVELLLRYSSRQTTKSGVLEFMEYTKDGNSLTPEWQDLRNKLAAIDIEEVCKAQSNQSTDGFQAAVHALDLMANVSTDNVTWQARVTLRKSDPTESHTLVRGIADSVRLEQKIGNKTYPVPFVLVGDVSGNINEVAQLDVEPVYSGRKLWPAITAREPKFGTHFMNKGTVVYYAFPPETEEEVVNNMVEFLLY
ncbi:hypothetical protein K8R43_06440 [archaeon]|nr:hypothetical protein [archaeon]